MKKKIKIALTVLGALVIAGIIVFFLSKDWMVGKAINKVQRKLKDKYGLVLIFGSYELEGWNKLVVNKVICLTPKKDTLAFMDNASVEVKMLPVLTGKIHLREMQAQNGMMNLSYIRQIKKPKTESKKDTITKFSKIKRYINYFEELTDALPSKLKIENISIAYKDSSEDLEGKINTLVYEDENASAQIALTLNGAVQNWKVNGTFDKRNKKTKLTVQSAELAFININKIRKKAKGDIGFKKILFELENFDNDNKEIKMQGRLSGENVLFYSEPVSSDTVVVDYGSLDYNTIINEEKIQLDSNSKLTLNQISGFIGGTYGFSSPQQISLGLKMPRYPVQNFLNSLPKGTFNKVKTMKIDGEIAYSLRAFRQKAEEDSIYFDSDLDGFNLKILDYGDAELNKLNSAFSYKPYNSSRRIIVGPENPSFVPIDEISDYLKESVNISEDGYFYSHKGFNEDAFVKSILDNLKAGRFRRGGSTISMQLVKNVFLSHEKAIDRKMEEAFMVWLIENLRLSSKKRMYEVYLNIIEWGPGIYGVGEASSFYFNKHPSQLNLSESIFLALIVPSPRSFKYKFDEQGNLKEYISGYYKLIGSKLLRRGKITEGQRDSLVANVNLTGPARDMLNIKMDTDAPEEEEPEQEKKWWQKILDKVF